MNPTNNFTSDDAPTDEEHTEWLALKKVIVDDQGN